MSLSFCIIVKNEEKNLPKCLASVQDIVDEIVVLDTGSSDRTPEIAKDFGAKVYHFEWCNDFAIARNESLKYVTGDWILILDADEFLAPEIQPQLLEAIQQDENHLVINLIRQEVGATQSPYSLVSRLFRRHPDIYFNRPYHAMIDDSVTEIFKRESHWLIGSLSDIAILHEGYQPGTIIAKNKREKAKEAMERFLVKNPNDAYECSKLGALYVEEGNLSKGIYLLEKGLKNKEIDPLVLYELNYHLGIAYSHKQKWDQVKNHYLTATAIDILPTLKLGAYNNLGNLYKNEGNLPEAEILYKTMLQIDPNFAIAYYNLGMTLKAMGHLSDAIALYQQAIRLNPEYAEAYQNLGVVFYKLGRVTESLDAFKTAIQLHEKYHSTEAERLRQGLRDMALM